MCGGGGRRELTSFDQLELTSLEPPKACLMSLKRLLGAASASATPKKSSGPKEWLSLNLSRCAAHDKTREPIRWRRSEMVCGSSH